ncbi:MAG: hypothetical protein MJ053_03990 [Elusimicrobiaceae bacterium]|nr:hypothetical protein [Elusimicrobiaceae bacterium]
MGYLFLPCAYAQASLEGAARGGALAQTHLAKQVHKTAMLARQMQRRYPGISSWGSASENFIVEPFVDPGYILSHIPARELYPEVPSLTQEYLPNYFLMRNNLATLQWMPVLEQNRQAITNHAVDFYREKTPITHSPQDDISWLARQVDDQTNYLFLGELNHYETITSIQVTALVHQIRLQQPHGREIFLFTEFLPKAKQWKDVVLEDDVLYETDMPTWETISLDQIPIIGLEPEFVIEYQPYLGLEMMAEHCQSGRMVWTSLEGIRLRNQHWKNLLLQYRTAHPDALFIIYAGAGHTEYTAPYSLGSAFSGPHTINVSLDPLVDGHTTDIGLFSDRTKKNLIRKDITI